MPISRFYAVGAYVLAVRGRPCPNAPGPYHYDGASPLTRGRTVYLPVMVTGAYQIVPERTSSGSESESVARFATAGLLGQSRAMWPGLLQA